MKTLEQALSVLRSKIIAKEIASVMQIAIMQSLVNFATKAKEHAEHIRQYNQFDDYGVTRESIEFDIKAFAYNLVQLEKAIAIRKKQPFQEFENGAIVGLN